MKINVLGMDPSLLNWGLAEGNLDLDTGILEVSNLLVIKPVDLKGKQIRVNSNDLHRVEQIAAEVIPAAQRAKVIFVEVPVGSQSARAMASYGICIGVLASVRALGSQMIEVTAMDTKRALTGNPNATKKLMIDTAISLYPEANFPRRDGKLLDSAEHVADAIGSIYSGVNTPMFLNLITLLKGL